MAFGEKPFGGKLPQVMNFRKVSSVQLSGYGWFSIILLLDFGQQLGIFFSTVVISGRWVFCTFLGYFFTEIRIFEPPDGFWEL